MQQSVSSGASRAAHDNGVSYVPVLRGLEGLRFLSSVAVASIHMLPHYGLHVPDGLNLFVDLFFIISGIVIANLYAGEIGDWSTYGAFIWRRIARLYPLHLLTLALYIVIGIGVKHSNLPVDDIHRYDTSAILPNLLLMQAWFPGGGLTFNVVSWSISAEFFVYLAFPIVLALVGRDMLLGCVKVLGAALLCVVVCEYSMNCNLYDIRFNYGELRALPSFAFGVWLSLFGPHLLKILGPRGARFCFLVCAVGVCMGMVWLNEGYLLLALIYALATVTYVCDIGGLETLASSEWLAKRGYLTYSIYMLHVPVTTIFISFIFPRVFGRTPYAEGLSLLLSVTIVFIAANLSFRYFEHPLRKLLTRRLPAHRMVDPTGVKI